MNIFILEDTEKRNVMFFNELASKFDLTIATSVREALEKHEGPYDIYLLDHDLGDGPSGLDFIRDSEIKNAIKGRIVVIHSYNHDGALRMLAEGLAADAKAFRMPFGPSLFSWVRRLGEVFKQREDDQTRKVSVGSED